MVEFSQIVFGIYIFLSILLIAYSKPIAAFGYKFILFYTDKLEIKELYVFKITDHNRDSMFLFMRWFVIIFGGFVIAFSLYKILL